MSAASASACGKVLVVGSLPMGPHAHVTLRVEGVVGTGGKGRGISLALPCPEALCYRATHSKLSAGCEMRQNLFDLSSTSSKYKVRAAIADCEGGERVRGSRNR